MEGLQKVAEGLVTGARGDGVKTKSGCENVILGQNYSTVRTVHASCNYNATLVSCVFVEHNVLEI